MTRTVIRILLAALLLCGLHSAHATWNPSWTKRARISLDTSASGLPLAGAAEAPVLVRLHTGNFQFLDAKPDGSDLRFIAADDKTPLKHHIEKYDAVNELALVWVQLPKVAPGAKSDSFWVYYGNPGAPLANDSKGSYDTAQGLVYHFGEGETVPQDATAYANHALRSSAKPGNAGLIGGGVTFDGSAEIALKVTPSLQATAGGLTVSMWLKPADLADADLYAQQDGAATLALQLRGGKLVAQAGKLATAPAGALAAGNWAHVALVVKDGLVVYLDGQEVARVAGPVAPLAGQATVGRGYKGEFDELQIAAVARPADWLRLAAGSQGPEQKLLAVAAPEGGGDAETASYLRILLGAVTLDGWVVIGILAVMFVISVWVMVTKALFINQVARDNGLFKAQFEGLIGSVRTDDLAAEQGALDREHAKGYPHSQLYRLYAAGVHELRGRFEAYRKAGRAMELSEQSLAAIRATVEARLVRELQRLNSQMVLLTIAIAGGPFLGLLGTVVGVMITFAAIAAAGDVNVNAIAPGIAAALVATVAGLAVAIPALFGYNYLTGRIGALTADMQVFVDELTTRFAEAHSA
jgi:biopolymer transport protein ExbB